MKKIRNFYYRINTLNPIDESRTIESTIMQVRMRVDGNPTGLVL